MSHLSLKGTELLVLGSYLRVKCRAHLLDHSYISLLKLSHSVFIISLKALDTILVVMNQFLAGLVSVSDTLPHLLTLCNQLLNYSDDVC